MFTALLKRLGIRKTEPMVSVNQPTLQEIAFESYLKYLYGLGIADLYSMRTEAAEANNKARVVFLNRVIKEKVNQPITGKTKTKRKLIDYSDTESEVNQLLSMATYLQRFEKPDDIVNSAPRTYTTGIEDHASKGRPFTDYERNTTRNHVPNPVYHPRESTYYPPSTSCSSDTNTSSDSYDSDGSSSCSSD